MKLNHLTKILFSTAIASTTLLTGSATIYSAPKERTVYVEGTKVNFSVNPIDENGSTLVQLRPIFEALGYTFEIVGNEIKIYKGHLMGSLVIGSKIAYHNTTDVILPVAPKIIKGNTMIPLTFIRSFGIDVRYDSNTNTVNIGSAQSNAAQKNSNQENSPTASSNYTEENEMLKFGWGTSKETLIAKLGKNYGVINDKDGSTVLVYKHDFTIHEGVTTYRFDNSGLIEVMYAVPSSTDLDNLFSDFTMIAMDLTDKYGDFSGSPITYYSSAKERTYNSLYSNAGERYKIALKNKDAIMSIEYNLPDTKIHLLLGITPTASDYTLVITYNKK